MFGLKLSGLPLETLAWMAGGAALIVTLLYLLKLRKRRVQVPFSPLWGKVLAEYRQQSDWWKRLRRLLSWLIQILLILALAFALADPHPEGQIIEGRHMMILLDSSASMAATDVSGGIDRMDIARKKAREILETVGPEDRVMLVNFNQQLQPLKRPRQAGGAIRRYQPGNQYNHQLLAASIFREYPSRKHQGTV